MKFSVLLPTRNRLEYLKYAIETVRRQDYQDWEIVVSDNCSEEDIGGYVQSIGDSRIRYYRTDSFVSVTDNWNNALEKSTGEYVIMLGDDDCLMSGYFSTVRRLVEEYGSPDCIHSTAFLYAYPGVMPGAPDGYLHRSGHADFLRGAEQPFLLGKEQALKMVHHSLNFRMFINYNMQYSTLSRKFINSLQSKGAFFQSPFPDYYATNVTFLKAESILIYPHPLVAIGITPKSYGFYHFNNCEEGGVKFLNSPTKGSGFRRLQRILLPGSNINIGWLFAMDAIKANYGSEFDLQVNYRRYRLLEVVNAYESYYWHGVIPKEKLDEVKSKMQLWEKVLYGGALRAAMLLIFKTRHKISLTRHERLVRWYKSWFTELPPHEQCKPKMIKQHCQNILEVFEQMS